jgi:hypothetical protein
MEFLSGLSSWQCKAIGWALGIAIFLWWFNWIMRKVERDLDDLDGLQDLEDLDGDGTDPNAQDTK